MNSTNTLGDNDTNLVRDDSIDGIITNATIPTLSSTTTTTSFPANNWGYRINNDVGGDSSYIDTTNTNFYSYAPGTLISSATTATNDNTANLTFGAKIDYEKPAGQYDLTLKFKALPTVTTYYMQDIAETPSLANTICTDEPTVVLDKRDEKAYTIRRIGGDGTSANPGDCWMVENLQFTGTELDSTTSNVASNYTPSNPYRVNNGQGYHSLTLSDYNYDDARIEEGDATTTITPIDTSTTTETTDTVWYNYAAASAGTITGNPNTNPQLYDICPAGWRLPNLTEAQSIGNGASTYVSSFSPIYGGYYTGGNHLNSTDFSSVWTSTASNNRVRYILSYRNNVLSVNNLVDDRSSGRYIRCVMKDTNINNLTYMQDFARVTESDTATGDNKKQQIINSIELNSTTGYSLKDIRDNADYTINKIGPADDISKQNVWMTKNLAIGCNGGARIAIQLTNDTSNVSTTWPSSFTILDDLSSGDDWTVPKMKCSENYGAWYNYAATSAGTITGSSNTNLQVYDICPAGWKIPTDLEQATLIDYTSEFNPVVGGYYSYFGGPGILFPETGFYWSATSRDAEYRYDLRYNASSALYTGSYARYNGLYVRCIAR